MHNSHSGTGALSPAESVLLLLKPLAAARALQISERKLWALTKAGKIPAVWIDGSKRYNRRALEAYVDGLKDQRGRS